ncbi:type I-F CRISPR-associated protein Csy2 [Pseudoalteromonas umbrosa]|uniref:type I-F CRISPR-associated protein Csy2 n=1 Tax=Pseudoalteromonas umbrosa TaxID=3048489 RepID=UPI0024C2A4AC|nr:type I-F CRISPR-associated protein Csy2 [Pseudoalteromonas sp. B95]MDK1288172.1 type I-F CRISPR-associated protein Csy2 [Pseudoalteromonas sp. B95]
MKQYILLSHIQVQNANAIAGFTWGFPAITHFLGFTHNLSRKLENNTGFDDISLGGCAIISHQHQVHTYQASRDIEFLQSKNPPYMHGTSAAKLGDAPPIIEEGKMNLTVSLLIAYEGNVGNRETSFINWLKAICCRQRLAGGSIVSIKDISLKTVESEQDVIRLNYQLLPGFVLLDKSDYLAECYSELLTQNTDAELLDAWLDFSRLKQRARPKSNLIGKHLLDLLHQDSSNNNVNQLFEVWQEHLHQDVFRPEHIPQQLIEYFAGLPADKHNKKLLQQWQHYCEPSNKTPADWNYVKRKHIGYLVPIMNGYKAISVKQNNNQVANTRDNETDVCFVEATHGIGLWCGIHKVNTPEALEKSLWQYSYDKSNPHWYLCKQGLETDTFIEFEEF